MNRNAWKKDFLKSGGDNKGMTKVVDNVILDNLDISYFSDAPVKLIWTGKDKNITVPMQVVEVETLDEFKRKFKRPIVLYQMYSKDAGGFMIRFGEV